MLPASDLTQILTNLSALQLEPNTTAQILAAVLAPLLRSADPEPPVHPRKHVGRPRAKPRKAAQPKRNYKRGAPDARDRARAALKANPNTSWTKVAAIAGVSRSTVCNAARELETEARKQARREARKARATPDAKTEPRARAVDFLRGELAHGPKPVSAVEEAAQKVHIDEQLLGQARRDLRIITSRANTGGAQTLQWSLPG